MRVEIAGLGRSIILFFKAAVASKLPLVSRLAALLVFAAVAVPASAHKDHREPAATAQSLPAEGAHQAGPTERSVASNAQNSGATDGQMGAMMEDMVKTRRAMTPLERVIDWLGRTHTVIVHFPIAFFPAALFTAVVGRRRPSFAKPVQFLVVAGGIIAPVAALLGWLDAGFDVSGDDWLLEVHRWLGTAVGLIGLALAVWAIRRPDEDRRPGMIAGLLLLTIAIGVQGWFGGALVHGIDHMNW